MFWENLKMAFISLRGAKLRSFLTMLGIIIGVAAVVSIVSIGNGLKASISQQVAGLGSNVITVISGSISGGKGAATSAVGTSTLTAADYQSIQKLPDVLNTAPIDLISGLVRRGEQTAGDALVIATTPAFNAIRNQKFEAGHYLTGNSGNQAVLGSAVKKELFGAAQAVGQDITIRDTAFTVVGVLASQDTGASLGGPSFDSAVYLPLDTAQQVTRGNVQIFRILVQADSADSVGKVTDEINRQILQNHGGQKDFSALTQADLLNTIGSILGVLTTAIVAIAGISLLVGGIGIMNIMLVSVTERTREIGIRKAIGASSRMVLTQFLIEAVVISLIGGLLGMVVAVVQASVGGHLAKISPVFTPGSFLVAFGVSVGIGIIFGLTPAIKAARMRPIQALRYE